MNKDEKQIIFEIYRACRLCGAGAGYKMPIIQSVINLGGEDIELKQKIMECVQIEVNNSDRMPPLICELCVDKVNDFFEFRRMCQEINKKTRLRLGLPLQTKARDSPEADDSIRGVTEPVYVSSDSDEGEPLSKHQNTTVKSKPRPKSAKTKTLDVKIKIENFQQVNKERTHSPSPEATERRETRKKRPPSPKRTRQTKTDDSPLSELQSENNSLLVPRQKRSREEVIIVPPPPAKKAKLPLEPPKAEKPARPGPKSSKVAAKPDPPQKQPNPCPKAGPKSRKIEALLLPPPAAKNQESLLPSSKVKKQESPLSSLKAKKHESPLPSSKAKKQESPLPSSKAKREASPLPSSKAKRQKSPFPSSKTKREESPLSSSKAKRQKSPLPFSKAKKQEYSRPSPKSRKVDSSPVLALRSKTRDPSPPAPRSRRREASPLPKAVSRASPPPRKSRKCMICGYKAMNPQGFASHLKSHTVLFTPEKQACNACELWFASADEASNHHDQHTGAGRPYTCSRCYDDFTTIKDYNLHFERNQCLATYEVPDVKCEECWHYYPTYKLLEDHKCPGEGGRPGGKCSNCPRKYSLLKNLVVHEIRCNRIKKKLEKVAPVKVKNEPVVDPEIQRRLLPMQVRIAKCDSLLEDGKLGGYDMSRVSHRFGLDNNYTYPYLYSMGDVRIKTEASTSTFDHMVAIEDEIKEEYLNNDNIYIHWDSDASSESDNDTCELFNPFGKKKLVDTLTALSLKTIFSPKLLGKVPRMKRSRLKFEKGFDSVLSIDFHNDISKDIDDIIINLGNETNNRGNHDSNSILDKDKKDKDSGIGVDLFDSLKTSLTNCITSASTVEEAKENVNDKESDKTDNSNDVTSKAENLLGEEKPRKTNSNDTQSNSSESVNYEENARIDDQDANELTHTKSDEDAKSKLTQHSNEALKATYNYVDADPVDNQNNNDRCRDDSNNGRVINNRHADENESSVKDKGSTPLTEDYNNENESSADNKGELRTGDLEKMDVDEQTEKISANNDATLNESLRENQVTMSSNKEDLNEQDDSQSSEVINYQSIQDSIADKEDSRSSSMTDGKTNHSDCTRIDSESDTIDKFFSANKSNDKVADANDETGSSLTSFKDSLTIGTDNLDKSVQSADRFNIKDLNDEDKQLMADLDAQIEIRTAKSEAVGVIGDSKFHNEVFGGNYSSSIVIDKKDDLSNVETAGKNDALNRLVQKQDNDLKSLDLDSISDEEFDFDL